MIQLDSKILSKQAATVLDDLQTTVNQETNFADRATKAKKLWNGKTGAKARKACFEEVKSTLEAMCVSIEVCNYCEQNEANDIEHIHPKSFFPELAFEWTNYLLACKQCNSGYKLDKCHIIINQVQLESLARGKKPQKGATIAFINPRIEDPNDFMLLDLGTDEVEGTWRYMIKPGLSTIAQQKAKMTIEILRLNSRDTLLKARKSAAIFYYQRMERLVELLAADSHAAIKKLLTPYDQYLDPNKSVEQNKVRIKAGFKHDIQTHQHPSVWYAIKVIQSKVNRRWEALFEQIPEALDW